MLEKDHANLLAILDAADKIQRFTKGISNADSFYANEKTFDAVLMNFVLIGETVSKLSEELKNENNHIPWQKIKGFRNMIAHDYFGVDAEEVWQIVKNNIPELLQEIKNVIK